MASEGGTKIVHVSSLRCSYGLSLNPRLSSVVRNRNDYALPWWVSFVIKYRSAVGAL